MSGNTGFSPIRCTVHVSMLPYSYTNNDVAQLFEPCGRIAQYGSIQVLYHSVTILKDRETRESKGVAWIQFVEYKWYISLILVVNQLKKQLKN